MLVSHLIDEGQPRVESVKFTERSRTSYVRAYRKLHLSFCRPCAKSVISSLETRVPSPLCMLQDRSVALCNSALPLQFNSSGFQSLGCSLDARFSQALELTVASIPSDRMPMSCSHPSRHLLFTRAMEFIYRVQQRRTHAY